MKTFLATTFVSLILFTTPSHALKPFGMPINLGEKFPEGWTPADLGCVETMPGGFQCNPEKIPKPVDGLSNYALMHIETGHFCYMAGYTNFAQSLTEMHKISAMESRIHAALVAKYGTPSDIDLNLASNWSIADPVHPARVRAIKIKNLHDLQVGFGVYYLSTEPHCLSLIIDGNSKGLEGCDALWLGADMAIVTNYSDVEDDLVHPKTYYIMITAAGRCYWKFGVCKTSVRQRYAAASDIELVDIISLWPHGTLEAARRHEATLFRKYKGDMPFFGRCGPLPGNGNTEIYSHDVLAGAAPPKQYFVKVLRNADHPIHLVAYADQDPREPFRWLHGQVRYMDWMPGPEAGSEGDYLQVPANSAAGRVTIAAEAYIQRVAESDHGRFDISRAAAKEALLANIAVRTWRDYPKFNCWGRPFAVDGAIGWVFAPHLSAPGRLL